MTDFPVSVIVVSRGRPKALCRCLMAVSQLLYHPFEVVVIADKAGASAARETEFADRLKIRVFEEANISKARNLGLALAAGKVVAFVDDDAVPEPGWLFHLAPAFSDKDVVAAGGFVRGRNGISFQWKGQQIDAYGYSTEIGLTGDDAVILKGRAGFGIKTQGANCAFRRETLAELGGFDPAFRYYLDEADVNLRLAERNALTAIVPRAEVHHGFEPSPTRFRNRMPKSLFEVGASQAVFLRKHTPAARFDESVAEFCTAQRKSIIRHMVAGNCEPRDVDRVMATLKSGVVEGAKRSITPLQPIQAAAEPFKSFRDREEFPQQTLISGYRMESRRLRQQARAARRRGDIVSLYLFSRTALFHRLTYREGCWEQTGGLFGKSVRTDPLFRLTGLKKRFRNETERVSSFRDPLDTADRIG